MHKTYNEPSSNVQLDHFVKFRSKLFLTIDSKCVCWSFKLWTMLQVGHYRCNAAGCNGLAVKGWLNMLACKNL